MSKFVVGFVAVACVMTMSAFGQNKVVFDNQSGEPALVKLIGPTAKDVEVPTGAKAGADAAAGRYIIKVRYGVPGQYRYSKGEEFEVTETPTTRSEITITLHKVVSGNYDAVPISETEFGKGSADKSPAAKATTLSSQDKQEPPDSTKDKWRTDWAAFVEKLKSVLRGDGVGALERVFDRQRVTWVGKVREMHWRLPELDIALTMSPKQVSLPNGKTADVVLNLLLQGQQETTRWEKIKAGDSVRFRTMLCGVGNNGTFNIQPTILVTEFTNGENMVIVSTVYSELVEVVGKETK